MCYNIYEYNYFILLAGLPGGKVKKFHRQHFLLYRIGKNQHRRKAGSYLSQFRR